MPQVAFCKTGEGAIDYSSKEIWDDWEFCLLPKIPMLAKENSRVWAWAFQQNIMGLNFEHTQFNFKTYPTISGCSNYLREATLYVDEVGNHLSPQTRILAPLPTLHVVPP